MRWRWPFGDPGLVRRDFFVLWAACGLVGAGIEVARRFDVPQVSFLQVGQGDCTVVQSHGQVMVVDAAGKTDHFDAGERLAVPGLRRLLVDRIDVFVLTHPDADHVGGLAALTSHFRIGEVAVPAHFQADLTMLHWLEGAGLDPAKVHWIKDSVVIPFGGGALTMATAPRDIAQTDNDGSMITKFELGKGSVVMTGDASSVVEDWLDHDPVWQAQILKAGHHGSRFSTSTEWLKTVRPTWVVFSCGRTNNYGHPSTEAIERASKVARTLRTDRDGTLTFRLENDGFHLAINHQTP